jgi:hypothetical protein
MFIRRKPSSALRKISKFEGAETPVGTRKIDVIYTRHASHHVTYFDEREGVGSLATPPDCIANGPHHAGYPAAGY